MITDAWSDLELSVVMPIYNEAAGVGPVVVAWLDELDRLGIRYEFLTYDDGSRDNTSEVLLEIAKRRPRLVAKRHPNMGHGPTIARGYRESRGQWVFQIDSDDEMGSESFNELWSRRADFDLLLGCRRHRQSSLGRQIISAGSRAIVRLLFGRGLWDVNTPYRLIRRSALTAILPRIPESVFAPNVIISGLAVRDGLRVHQTWVPHQPRQFGTGSIVGWTQWRTALRCVVETAMVARQVRTAPAVVADPPA